MSANIEKLIEEASRRLWAHYHEAWSEEHTNAVLRSLVDEVRQQTLEDLTRLVWATLVTTGPAPWERNWNGRDESAEAWKARIVGLLEDEIAQDKTLREQDRRDARRDLQERFERYSEEPDEAHSATVGVLLEDGIIQRLLSESAEGTKG